MRLTPGKMTLAELEAVYRGGPVEIDPACRGAVERSAQIVEAAARGVDPIYGVNTGFGKLASVRIPADKTELLQRNLILSHCAGVGPSLSTATVRLTLALKLASLAAGASGVRFAVVRLLEDMLARGVTPEVPSQGSVGASGDLAPLAHVAAVMIGEGRARFEGSCLPGKEALERAGLAPLALGAKEGLALINGTQVSTALALGGLFDAWCAGVSSLVTGALSTDAAMGSAVPFRAEIQELRRQPGQRAAARLLHGLLEGSEIRESHRDGDDRVQDPYCLRCQPQVAGAALDVLRAAGRVLTDEANAVTDNPLVLSDGSIVSGGNFHAQPVAFAADHVALAIAELGSISQRRIALLVDPTLSHGLPAFLSPDPGLNSGLMIAEVASAALMSENKALANPRSVDSTPTSANQEDHVSMACHAARRLGEMNRNLAGIVGVEAIAAAQGVELRAPLATSPRLRTVVGKIRESIAPLGEDRYLADDLAEATRLVEERVLQGLVPAELVPELQDPSR